MANVDLQLIEGLGLPYVPVAEAGLADPALDPIFDIAWQGFVALFPGQTLLPLFDELPIEQLADLVDSVRLNGEEPPNPFVWFTMACGETEADAIVAALLALPMVVYAAKRPRFYPASFVSYGTNTGPAHELTRQIMFSPIGVDATYAWQVPGGTGAGVRVTDIEHGWELDHEELYTADITKQSVFGNPDEENRSHGTASVSVVVAADNGLGLVGIAPDASMSLVSVTRPNGQEGLANAIKVAASQLQAGDILLLEVATNFYQRPPKPDGTPDERADILIEFYPDVQLQIRLATGRGIIVIEPAGNGGVPLDKSPFLAHTRPESKLTFSGAVVVGGAKDIFDPPRGEWQRISSFGSRVDCFASAETVDSAWGTDATAYFDFSGTSSASAIIAGVAASIQGMSKAAGRGVFSPADMRRLLSNASTGVIPEVQPADGLDPKIGSMPDLRRLTKSLGFARIVPVGAARIGGDAVVMVQVDADNHMLRRHFTFFTGWGQPVATPSSPGSPPGQDGYPLNGVQPAVLSMEETDPAPRVVHHAFFSGGRGIHHMWWDSNNQAGNVIDQIAPKSAAAYGHAVAAAEIRTTLVAVAAITPFGRMVVLTGHPNDMLNTATPALEIDAAGRYRRLPGPAMVSRATGLIDIIAIEDGGTLTWWTGDVPEPGVYPAISDPITDTSGVTFESGARPALVDTGYGLLVAAIANDLSLRVTALDPFARTIDVPVVLSSAVPFSRHGPVALVLLPTSVVVMAVDLQNNVQVATRPVAGGAWTPFIPVLSIVPICPMGGVTLVRIDLGVMALAVAWDGRVCSAVSADGVLWSPFVPLP